MLYDVTITRNRWTHPDGSARYEIARNSGFMPSLEAHIAAHPGPWEVSWLTFDGSWLAHCSSTTYADALAQANALRHLGARAVVRSLPIAANPFGA